MYVAYQNRGIGRCAVWTIAGAFRGDNVDLSPTVCSTVIVAVYMSVCPQCSDINNSIVQCYYWMQLGTGDTMLSIGW